jgi:hypothetical protein
MSTQQSRIRKLTRYLASALIGVSLVLAGCRPDSGQAMLVQAYIKELVLRWAPIHYQDVDPTGTWSLGGRSDFITTVDFDGDWNTANNWENISPDKGYLAVGQAYYSVVLTETHAFIIYAFYHPRDWNRLNIQLDAHENDMEGVLEVVELPGRLGEPGFDYADKGVLKALVTVFHLNFYSYRNTDIPSSDQFEGRDEDIDGKIRFMDWQGGPHPVTAQQAEGHGLKAWPYVDIKGGDGLVYYPAWEGQSEPSGPDDRDNLYGLVDIFKEGGLWDRREDPETFASFGVFHGEKYQWHTAHAPWGWDDADDQTDAGVIAEDPIRLVRSYFSNTGAFSERYILNHYQGIAFDFP